MVLRFRRSRAYFYYFFMATVLMMGYAVFQQKAEQMLNINSNQLMQDVLSPEQIILSDANKMNENAGNERQLATLAAVPFKENQLTSASAPEMKTILLWTTWYGLRNGFDFGYGPDKFSSCPVPHCQLTDDRSLFNRSAAVVFQTQVKDWNAADLPTHRFAHQRFIKYNYEPEIFSVRSIYDSVGPHFYNWTYTHRRDSDIVGFRYGLYRLVADSLERPAWTGNYQEEESLDNFYGVNISGKSITAAWFVSHCQTDIGRELYVAQLQKYIRVDIYGRCGNLTCYGNEHARDTCDEKLKRDYLFYLSFENNFCPDYVTEKLFRGFLSETVPVVLGGGHYTRFAPPHSYINVLDYESPKQLADYLIKLSQNRRLYAHYFEWRRHFRMQEKMPIDSWCNLCKMLHDPSLPPKSYENITKWWFDDYPCDDHGWKKQSFQVSS